MKIISRQAVGNRKTISRQTVIGQRTISHFTHRQFSRKKRLHLARKRPQEETVWGLVLLFRPIRKPRMHKMGPIVQNFVGHNWLIGKPRRNDNAGWETLQDKLDGRPGLVVMGEESCVKVVGSNPSTDEHFFTYNCCKTCNVCLKRGK